MPARSPQLLIRILRIISRLHDIFTNDIQLPTLLVHHVRHVSEKLV